MREAHALRIALGRGADTSPDWQPVGSGNLLHGFTEVSNGSLPEANGSSTDEPRLFHHADAAQRAVHRGQRFNDRGRPVNARARNADSDQCNAQNIAQQIAAANMPRDITLENARVFAEALKAENDLRNQLGDYFLWAEFAARHWVDAAGHRWMTFRSYGDFGFIQGLVRGYQQRGFWAFAFAGFVPYAVSAEAHERLDLRLAKLDDDLKQVSWPSLPEYLGGATLISIARAATEVLFFGPLSIWTHLQTMGLLPGTPVLPSLAFFNPLSSVSPFQPLRLSWSLLYSPLAVQIALDNIDKYISSHFFALTQNLEYKLDALSLGLEFDTAESNIPDDLDIESVDSDFDRMDELLSFETTRDQSRPPRAWRIIKASAPSSTSFSLLATLRRGTASVLVSLLRCVPRRPSNWTQLNPETTFDALRTTDDWSSSPYGTDMGPSSLHQSPTDCADYIWRQLVMYPFHIVSDIFVMRSIAHHFLQGTLAPGLLAAADPLALRAVGDTYPLMPTFSFSALRLSQSGGIARLGLGMWRGVRPFLSEWALRACIGVAVCGLHTVVVGVLVRRRSAQTREALNWRDNGRRDWS